MNERYSSRKFLISVVCLVLGLAFGVYCATKGVDLLSAGAYWGAVSAGVYGYCHQNVSEKVKLATVNGGGSK